MAKKCISVLLCVIMLCGLVICPASAYMPSSFSVTAEGCLLASLDNGTVLYEKNADERLYPASLTKIMTATVVLDLCDSPKDTVITVNQSALTPLLGTDSSVIGLKDTEQLSALDLLYVLLVYSANDAANVLAEYFGGGSISDFVTKMNEKAAELNMTGTHYVNPHGLHDSNHYTTPRDMYLLTKYALQNETFKEIFGTVRYTLPATNLSKARIIPTTVFMQDPNSMMPSAYYRYTTGGKTGYTDDAGRCLITTATKGGVSYLCVLMKCPVTDASGKKVRYEFADAKNLYEWAFNDFEYRLIYDTQTPVGECPVELSQESDHVALVLKRNVNAVIPKGTDHSTIKIELELYHSPADAPIAKGQELGIATIQYAGETIDTVPVVAMTDVEKSGLLAFVRTVTDLFTHPITKTILLILAAVIFLFIAYCFWLNRHRKKRRRRSRVKLK